MQRQENNLGNFLFRIFLAVVRVLKPSLSHRLIIWGIKDGSFPTRKNFDPVLRVELFGKTFKNPVGVAAGFDRDCALVDRMIDIGWGFGELGSFSLEADFSLSDTRYLPGKTALLTQTLGCPNIGLRSALPKLAARRHLPNLVGISITSTSRNEEENIKEGKLMTYEQELALVASKIAPYADFIVLNLAHPNCDLYRLIAEPSIMVSLIQSLQQSIRVAAPINTPKLLIKVPADLTEIEIPQLCHYLMDVQIDGIVVAGPMNLTRHSKNVLKDNKIYRGLLSGAPLKENTIQMVTKIYQHTKGKTPIIACGGIMSGKDAFECIKAGASLVQIYTGINYKGPMLVNDINHELVKLLKQRGFKSVQEAVGSAYI